VFVLGSISIPVVVLELFEVFVLALLLLSLSVASPVL
jgi:hypothetical protein